jgi:hypothetical protein
MTASDAAREREMHDRVSSIPPVPAAPGALAYVRAGVLPRRPAVLTGLGVVTLVYATLGFLVNVCSFAFHAGVWWLEPPPSPRLVPSPPPIPHVNVEPYDGDPAGADGLDRAARDAVVKQAREQMQLPADRAEMLRRLLADVGGRMFPPGLDLTSPAPDLFRDPARVAGPDGEGPRASHAFATPRGRVELSDFTATFAPDGAGAPVRLVRTVLYDGDTPLRWSSSAIAEALEALNGALTAEQASVLLRELRDGTPDHPESWLVEARLQMIDTSTQPIAYVGGGAAPVEKWLLPDGRTVARAAAPRGVDLETGAPLVRTQPRASTYWPGDRGAFALLAMDGLLSAILAAYLFVGAVMLLRDVPSSAERLVRFLILKAPLVLLCATGATWWVLTEHAYLPPSTLPGRLAELVPIALGVTLVYPTALAIAMRLPRVRRFFLWRGEEPWYPLRCAYDAVRAARPARPTGVVLATLALAHVMLAAWCARTAPHASVQAATHVLAALVAGAAAGVLLYRPIRPWRAGALAMLALLAGASFAPAQPESQFLSPWAVEDLLARAQGDDLRDARDAVRKLARAGDAGQEALLRLLDGPVPPVGLDGVLDAIGQEWFDNGSRWSRQHRPRALRLVLEWVEVIEHAEDVRAIAVLEAMGREPELEPLLRPLLTAPSPAVRARAAQFLLRVNPRPTAMVRALERDLGLIGKPAIVAEALVHLRPTSDPVLARLMTDLRSPSRPHVVTALVTANAPLSPELLEAAQTLAREQSPAMHRTALLLMRYSVEGRREMIDISLGSGPAVKTARELLREHWPEATVIFDRLHARAGDRARIESAARRVLNALNDDADLDALTDVGDDELRAQALIVLADGKYAERLGPVTVRLTGVVEPLSDAPVRWQRAAPPAHSARRLGPPPPVLSAAVCTVTAAVLLATLGLALRRDGSDAPTSTTSSPP